VVDNIPLKYVTIVNQNGESSKSTKRKTTDHQQEKIKEYEKNRTRTFLPHRVMLQKIRFFDKKEPKLSLSELLSRITRIQIYAYDLLCEPVLSMRTV
jgi:hypothetical protein